MTLDFANDRNTNGSLMKKSTCHRTKFEIYGYVLIEKTVNTNDRGGADLSTPLAGSERRSKLLSTINYREGRDCPAFKTIAIGGFRA